MSNEKEGEELQVLRSSCQVKVEVIKREVEMTRMSSATARPDLETFNDWELAIPNESH